MKINRVNTNYLNSSFKQESAAITLQRRFRSMLKKTFNSDCLNQTYLKKHKNESSKAKKLTITQVDFNKKKNRRLIRSCVQKWQEFVHHKLHRAEKNPKRYSKEFVGKLRSYGTVFSCLQPDLKGANGMDFFIAKDEKNIQGICVAKKVEKDSAVWKIDELMSSPINAHKKYRGQTHVEGVGPALIAHTALQSHADAMKSGGTEQKDRAMVVLISSGGSDPFYEHLGFNEYDGDDETLTPIRDTCTFDRYLRGEELRLLLRKYGARAEKGAHC